MKKIALAVCMCAALSAGAMAAQPFAGGARQDMDGVPGGMWQDDLIRYTHFFVEPALRLKGGNTDSGKGVDFGVYGSHDKNGMAIGLSVGYYRFAPKDVSGLNFNIVPVMVRVGGDLPLTSGGTRLAVWVAGGYSINNYDDDNPALSVDMNNSYILAGQVGLKFPLSQRFAVSILGGYQYLKPQVTVRAGGISDSSYVALDAGYAKLALEF